MMTSPSPLPLVMLVVGTDHHPFDRAVGWVDDWAATNADRARVVIQYGTSRPPVHAEGHDLLPVAELESMMAHAVAVVCHGGPGTIMGAREAGVVPICIPRQSSLGEHVDDHQVRFATRVAQAGQVHLASTADELAALLDRALGDDDGFRLDLAADDPAAAAVARFAELVDRLVGYSRTTDASVDGMNGVSADSWPSVGVVITTRERPEPLRRAIRSVLSQPYPGPIECVVVFDGSPAFDLGDVAPPDGGDRALRVIENRRTPGHAGARNSGAEHAFGEMLAFCDDQDEWLPGKLLSQVAALRRSGADVAVTGIEIALPDGRTERVPAGDRVTRDVLLRARSAEIHPSTVVVRREAFHGSIGPLDEAIPGSYGQDHEWLLRGVAVGDLVAVREPLVRVHRPGRSFVAAHWQGIAEGIGYLTVEHPDLLEERREAARLYGRLAFAEAALGRASAARGWAWRSILRRPLERRPYLALAVSARLIRPETVEAFAIRFGRGVRGVVGRDVSGATDGAIA